MATYLQLKQAQRAQALSTVSGETIVVAEMVLPRGSASSLLRSSTLTEKGQQFLQSLCPEDNSTTQHQLTVLVNRDWSLYCIWLPLPRVQAAAGPSCNLSQELLSFDLGDSIPGEPQVAYAGESSGPAGTFQLETTPEGGLLLTFTAA